MSDPMTHHARQMLQAHPRRTVVDETALLACLEACLKCAQSCISCADACSAEADPKMLAKCVRLDQDCADLCAVTARILTRQTETDASVVRSVLEACAVACAACATECEKEPRRCVAGSRTLDEGFSGCAVTWPSSHIPPCPFLTTCRP